MAIGLEYHSDMGRRISATVAALALSLVTAASAGAQVHGVPASVTSFGFGGRFSPGVPASVTSLGPRGFQHTNRFFTTPGFNPVFPRNTGSPRFFRGRRNRAFFPFATPVYSVPYTPVVIVQPTLGQPMYEEEEEAGGPTIFDRRGSARYERERYSERRAEDRIAEAEQPSAPAAPPAPIPEQPPTVLVFKDGRTVEVQNYAILGPLVYDLTPGHPRKIPLADLDLQATTKQNDDRGIDFRLPAAQIN